MPVSDRARIAALLLSLSATWPAFADFKAYVRGQEAAAEGNWSEVESEMQTAYQSNARAQARARLYGQRFAPYVPQYYLGLAAYKQNDCATAVRWFSDAGASAVIAQITEFKGVADTARSDCAAKIAVTKPAEVKPADPKPPIITPTETKPVVSKPVVSNPVVPPPVPKPPVEPRPPTTAPVTTNTAPVASTAPAALQTALQNWLAGRYRSVVSTPTAGVQDRALAHLYLLRAASYHALADIEAANADAHRENSAREIRAARAALASIAPDATFYSPRFRQYFAQVR